MKILLDENIDEMLKQDFKNIFEIFSVRDMGWKGKKNGTLIKNMLERDFRVLITGDKHIEHQQNFKKYPVTVIIFNTPSLIYEHIRSLVPQIIGILQSDLKAGVIKVP